MLRTRKYQLERNVRIVSSCKPFCKAVNLLGNRNSLKISCTSALTVNFPIVGTNVKVNRLNINVVDDANHVFGKSCDITVSYEIASRSTIIELDFNRQCDERKLLIIS